MAMASVRDEFAAALKQTADRINHLLSLWPSKDSHDDLEFARDLMLSRRNQLRHSELPMYINDAQDAVVVEGQVEVLLDPPVRLRVADRFRLNDQGLIAEQTNYFDPRDVTNPGWR